MPFTASSAKKHKKGLSSSQAKKWSKIANSVRDNCLTAGGTEKHCDGQAIRAANSRAKKS